jgi:predicted Zn-dependent protease
LQKRTTGHDAKGFGKTHPEPKDRIAEIDSQMKGVQSQPVVAERQKRFERMVAGL